MEKGTMFYSTLAVILWFIAIMVGGAIDGPPEVPVELAPAVSIDLTDAPQCWEDEVIVQVVYDPYDISPGVGTLGCVPGDNLPVAGYRP